jgi:hypothetical protein
MYVPQLLPDPLLCVNPIAVLFHNEILQHLLLFFAGMEKCLYYPLHLLSWQNINWLKDTLYVRVSKTERYCLSSFCFEMTRHARSPRRHAVNSAVNVVDEHPI